MTGRAALWTAWCCNAREWDALSRDPVGRRFLVTITAQLPDQDEEIVADVGQEAVLAFRREGQKFIGHRCLADQVVLGEAASYERNLPGCRPPAVADLNGCTLGTTGMAWTWSRSCVVVIRLSDGLP